MTVLKRALTAAALLVLLAFPFVIYLKAQALSDWWALRGYSPPRSVESLADQDSMTAAARHIFFVNRPAIETDASKFRADCGETEKTIILGCYHSNQAGIFVYDVQDSRLAGIQQVTAAHEMLHAAYDRLSTQDKRHVNSLLQDYFDNGLKDRRIIDTINSYKQSEPNDIVNEMHSIFGTEIANLPPALQAYYSRYFSNRPSLTAFAGNYQAEFTSREDRVKADDVQLAQLKRDIDSAEQSLGSLSSRIDADRASLDGLRSSGQIQQYNSGVSGFNSEVSAYNLGVQKLKAEIVGYNQLVEERNSIATELVELDRAIDTRLVPQQTQ